MYIIKISPLLICVFILFIAMGLAWLLTSIGYIIYGIAWFCLIFFNIYILTTLKKTISSISIVIFSIIGLPFFRFILCYTRKYMNSDGQGIETRIYPILIMCASLITLYTFHIMANTTKKRFIQHCMKFLIFILLICLFIIPIRLSMDYTIITGNEQLIDNQQYLDKYIVKKTSFVYISASLSETRFPYTYISSKWLIIPVMVLHKGDIVYSKDTSPDNHWWWNSNTYISSYTEFGLYCEVPYNNLEKIADKEEKPSKSLQEIMDEMFEK